MPKLEDKKTKARADSLELAVRSFGPQDTRSTEQCLARAEDFRLYLLADDEEG